MIMECVQTYETYANVQHGSAELDLPECVCVFVLLHYEAATGFMCRLHLGVLVE